MGRLWEILLRCAAAALPALAIAACAIPTEFITPIEEPGTRKVDPRLLGTWYGVSGCRFVSAELGTACRSAGNRPALLILLHITPENDATALTIRETAVALDLTDLGEEIRRHAAGRVIQFEVVAHPALLDSVGYFSMRRRAGFGYDYTGDGERPHYIIAQIDVDGQDLLRYRLLSHEPLNQDAIEAQGLRRAIASRDDKQVLDYLIAEFSRDQLLTFLRERHYPTIDGYTFGPFRRLPRDVSMASMETLACAPDQDRRWPRFDSLASASEQLARQGHQEEARSSAALALAAERAGVRHTQMWPYRLAALAEAQARAGDLDGAKEAFRHITGYSAARSRSADAEDMAASSWTVAAAAAWAGDIGGAHQLAEALPGTDRGDSQPRASAFASIATAQAQRGDWAGAMESARRAGTVRALLDVEAELVRRGDNARARATLAEAAVSASASVQDLLSIAELQWKRGLHADATRTAQAAVAVLQAKPGDQFVHERIRLAKAQVGFGDLESARSVLASLPGLFAEEKVRVPDGGSEAVKLIALQSSLGDQVAARAILQRLLVRLKAEEAALDPTSASYQWHRYQLNMTMAQGHAAIGEVDSAIALAEALDPGHRVQTLYAIVEIQQFVHPDPFRVREPLQLAYDSGRVLPAINPEAFAASPYGIAAMARIHQRAGDDRRARLLYLEAEQIAMRAPLSKYERVGGVQKRTSDLLMIAGRQHDDGFATDARQTSLRALGLIRSMPELAPCGSDELLWMLALPEIDRAVK